MTKGIPHDEVHPDTLAAVAADVASGVKSTVIGRPSAIERHTYEVPVTLIVKALSSTEAAIIANVGLARGLSPKPTEEEA